MHALDSDCTVLVNPCIEAAFDATLDSERADEVNKQKTEQTVSLQLLEPVCSWPVHSF